MVERKRRPSPPELPNPGPSAPLSHLGRQRPRLKLDRHGLSRSPAARRAAGPGVGRQPPVAGIPARRSRLASGQRTWTGGGGRQGRVGGRCHIRRLRHPRRQRQRHVRFWHPAACQPTSLWRILRRGMSPSGAWITGTVHLAAGTQRCSTPFGSHHRLLAPPPPSPYAWHSPHRRLAKPVTAACMESWCRTVLLMHWPPPLASSMLPPPACPSACPLRRPQLASAAAPAAAAVGSRQPSARAAASPAVAVQAMTSSLLGTRCQVGRRPLLPVHCTVPELAAIRPGVARPGGNTYTPHNLATGPFPHPPQPRSLPCQPPTPL